jgi:hypothetical protein
LTDVVLKIYDSGSWQTINYWAGSDGYNYFWLKTGGYQLKVERNGYYSKTLSVWIDETIETLTVQLDQIQRGGGGSRPPMFMQSKHFIYSFEVFNACSSSYDLWHNLVKVYPVTGKHVLLNLKIHYYTDFPIVEIFAYNISALTLNFEGVYAYLKCPFHKKASAIMFIVYSDSPLVVSVENMLFKPTEVWKHKPGDAKPVKISNWSFAGNILTFAVSAEDPAFSILSNPLQVSIDLAHQMAAILIVLAMLAVALGFVKKWVS